ISIMKDASLSPECYSSTNTRYTLLCRLCTCTHTLRIPTDASDKEDVSPSIPGTPSLTASCHEEGGPGTSEMKESP
ncbi:hypothetical protein KUCAC02_006660, partial [Chaenocephalus aceratus]